MDERIFDVSKPHKVNPGATSKPVIVGHHPEIPDPMIRENAPDKPQIPDEPEFGPPSEGNPLGLPDDPVTEPPAEPEKPETPALPELPEDKPELPPALEADAQPAEKQPVSTDQPPPTAQMFNKATGQTVEPTHSSWKPEHELPIAGHHSRGSRGFNKTPLIIVGTVLAFLGVYALLDSGLVIKVDLPFRIFSQNEGPNITSTPSQPSPTAQPTVTANYTVTGTDVSFSYPLAWGSPSITRDPGFSKRGGENETNGTYAYLVNFAGNKNVQVAITSSQYLPAKRTPLYYDFQQWCSGTADGKIYKEVLMFSTTDGVDTPTTVACNEGPLADAVKSSDKVIVQAKTKDADGKAIGDVYTVNLDGNDLPVLRIKDASSTNSEEIEKFITSIKG